MDDFVSGIKDLLSTQEGQKSLEAIAGMFNTDNNNGSTNDNSQTNSSDNNNALDSTNITNILGSLLNNNSNNSSNSEESNNSSGGLLDNFDMVSSFLSMQDVLGKFNGNDNNTALLLAIKPFLSDERQKKVDSVIKILKIAQMWPAIKQSGIIDKFL